MAPKVRHLITIKQNEKFQLCYCYVSYDCFKFSFFTKLNIKVHYPENSVVNVYVMASVIILQ